MADPAHFGKTCSISGIFDPSAIRVLQKERHRAGQIICFRHQRIGILEMSEKTDQRVILRKDGRRDRGKTKDQGSQHRT